MLSLKIHQQRIVLQVNLNMRLIKWRIRHFIKCFLRSNENGCSTAPLNEYKNNKIYQEITTEKNYTTTSTDDKILIALRRSKGYKGYTDELEKITGDDSSLGVAVSLKKAAAKKMRLRIICRLFAGRILVSFFR